jgi:hypothetical protein
LECLDDDHAAAAAGTRMRERLRLAGLAGGGGVRGAGLYRQHVEQAAGSGNVVGARAAGEQAVVTDAVEARRQDVDQESADELAGGECHDLLAITTFGAIVLPSEGDAIAVAGGLQLLIFRQGAPPISLHLAHLMAEPYRASGLVLWIEGEKSATKGARSRKRNRFYRAGGS